MKTPPNNPTSGKPKAKPDDPFENATWEHATSGKIAMITTKGQVFYPKEKYEVDRKQYEKVIEDYSKLVEALSVEPIRTIKIFGYRIEIYK